MELCTLNTLCLGNQLTVNFATEWSSDGRLFILSDNCIYVMKLTAKMTNIENVLSFSRSEITLTDYFAATDTGINYEKILFDLSQQNMYHHILNFNLTPKTALTNLPSISAISAAWSPTPNENIQRADALLAIVSNTGNLEIYAQNKHKWCIVAHITQLWVVHLKKDWESQELCVNVDKLSDIHLKRVNSVLVTCFGWSKIFTDTENYLFVVAGHLNGYISIWKINYFNASHDSIKVELFHSFNTNLNNLTAVHINFLDDSTALVVYGNMDGLVKNKILMFNDLENEEHNDIWSHKDVRVSKIISVNIDQNIGIIVIKGPFIIFSVLSKDGNIISTSHLNIGNLNISGIQLICPGSYVVTTVTGVIQKLKIVKTVKGYETRLFQIISDLKWDYHACYGVIKSPNDILWGILIQPCKLTDHLTLRNPIQLTFCTTKNFDPGSYLKNNPSMQLLHSWECIEILRCQSVKNNTLPCSWLAKIEKFDELSLYEIRLFMWISLICQTFIQRRGSCRKLKSTLPPMLHLKEILYLKYNIERINYLLNKFEMQRTLSEFEYTSLYLLFDAVKIYQNENNFSQYFSEITIEEIKTLTIKYEQMNMQNVPKCIWCEENLTSKPCTTNHPDQRCSISGVQISGIAKWECSKCGLTAHELIEDNKLFCPLCDVPMIQVI